MRYLILIFCFSIFNSLQAQESFYNKTLADSLGADDYGMKAYYLVILKTGSSKVDDKVKLSEIFSGHMENIGRLADSGKLVVAGPLMENENKYRGIYIFNAANEQEVEGFLKTDPAVSSGVLDAEIYGWYGSAALPVYLETHKQIEKIKP